MTAGWVAATMRGRALLRRSTGVTGARAIAATDSWDAARELLIGTVAGRDLPVDADRVQARAAASAATLWQLRVLAGWVPPVSTGLVRLAVGPVEIGNIEGHVAALEGAARRDPVALGSLGTVWPRIAGTTSMDAVRATLRRTSWGDPGGNDRFTIAFGLRVGWLRRVLSTAPGASAWARGALVVLLARERFAFDREVCAVTGRDADRMIGYHWRNADTLADLVDGLKAPLRWPFVDVDGPDDLWRAEHAVLARVAADAATRATTGGADAVTFTAILAVLLVDLWRVHAAIDLAGRGRTGEEVFDALAA